MVTVRKRKMARSSVCKNTKRVKDKQKKVKLIPHPVMAAHWDKKLSWRTNYERFGLQARLGKHISSPAKPSSKSNVNKIKEASPIVKPETIANETDPEKIPLGEARLIRDPETNEVVEIIYGKMEPEVEEPEKPAIPIIEDLLKYNEEHAQPAKRKTLNQMDCHLLAKLDKKYGDDYEKMKWDQNLNPFFLSVGQLKKKLEIWRAMEK